LPGLPAVAGKPVHAGFDGGRLTSDGGILLLAAVEQRLQAASSPGSKPEPKGAASRFIVTNLPRLLNRSTKS
jgi:hypothetical protein